MYQLNPLMEFTLIELLVPVALLPAIGSILGYTVSRLRNKELKIIKEKDPELYDKILLYNKKKAERATKSSLIGAGIGTGLGIGIGGTALIGALKSAKNLKH